MSLSSTSHNVNQDFFAGHYKDIWRTVFSDKFSAAESEWISQNGQLGKGSRVMDLMCGYGRHALELGKKGMEVRAIDNLPEYIDEINQQASELGLNVKGYCEDVLRFQEWEAVDAVLCMGNSLQFFPEADLRELLVRIARQLKPGGRFYIGSWMILEIALKQFQANGWSRMGDMLFLVESSWALNPTRIETNSIIITSAGEREEKKGVDYIFSLAEMRSLLQEAGLSLVETWSIPGKKEFSVNDPRIYMVAEKQ